ncbi:type I secretion system permease/ATPase [Lutibaculum baratangense]|uniref:Type I secretion system ATPase n=1 Tax=Lutibaculum baratangense AMV1 TaxID=631454 RepID=V4RCF1_9HYPH|nr:type I secretion system permease/ATPase [Lutibaculum baratangense]ESR23069.1 type I secretion system ATPase [Lutibaculum baratangense AMV1]
MAGDQDPLAGCRRGLLAAGGFSLALNLLMLTVPLYMTSVYDRVLSSRSGETLLMLTLVAVGALALAGLLEAVRQIVLMRTGARLEAALGERLLHISLSSPAGNESEPQGLRDLSQLRQFLSSPTVCAVFDAPVAPLFMALLFIIHPHLGWITLAASVLLLAVSYANRQLTKHPLSEAAQSGSAALQRAQVQARNADVIRAMGMTGSSVGSWWRENAVSLSSADRAGVTNASLSGLSRFLRLILQISILGYGALLVLTHSTMSAGIIFAASIISARALAPVDQIVGGWKSFVAAGHSWRRIKAILEGTPEPEARMKLPVPDGSVAVEKLIHAPATGGEPIIKGISFEIEPGEVVGVIGPSGAGKSTLARLLVGALQPTQGLVRIGGDDLRHWAPDALGPHVGYVPQDVELFPTTIACNIARMDPNPDADEVVTAARLAGCHKLIQRMRDGYETVIGPSGQVLSGGQRQRVALARALYGRPRVVVLDEPNASLDGEGEHALVTALQACREAGITCIVITQRPNVVPALTQLLVLREGRIEDFGPKEDVLRRQMRRKATDGAGTGARVEPRAASNLSPVPAEAAPPVMGRPAASAS